MTQRELARRVGCALVTIQKIEEDRRRPSQELAERLADVLAIPPEDRVAFVPWARTSSSAGQSSLLNRDASAPSRYALPSRRRNLPVPHTSLIGREQHVAAVRDYLLRTDIRLLTLIGPPGIGKTRLCLQVAADVSNAFAGGICFVALAPICDPGLVVATIAQALGIRESAGQALLNRLKQYLGARQLLLVLDNFEQLLPAAPCIAELLTAAPWLKVLVTSRAVLHLSGEHVFPVPPLALPDLEPLPAPEALVQYAAVELFVQRTRAVKPDFTITDANAPMVAQICHRLDGLPLAIELAAARGILFSPPALLARLTDRLTLLKGGPCDLPPRQQTLRSAIDWSYDLLNPGEQILFGRLAVFASGCTMEAVEAVCSMADDLQVDVLDGLASLIGKSLLRQEVGAPGGYPGEVRFTMLETIREYALERLVKCGEAEVAQRRHAEYYLALAEAAERKLQGPEQGAWLKRLEAEHANLRAALAWSQAAADGAEIGLRMAGALWLFWQLGCHEREGREWLMSALARREAAGPIAAKALTAAGFLAWCQHDLEQATTLLEQGLALFRELEVKAGIATSLDRLGLVAFSQNNHELARALWEESLALSRELGDRWASGWVLMNLGHMAQHQNDDTRAVACYTESLALFRELEFKSGSAVALMNLGHMAQHQGDDVRAAALYGESLALFQALGVKSGSAEALHLLGHMAQHQGDNVRAAALYGESLALFRALEDKQGSAYALNGLACVAQQQGDDARARALYVESLALYHEDGGKLHIALGLAGLAGVAMAQGQPERAARLCGAVGALRLSVGGRLFPADRARYERYLAAARAELDEATFVAAWAEGHAMPLEQVITYALRA